MKNTQIVHGKNWEIFHEKNHKKKIQNEFNKFFFSSMKLKAAEWVREEREKQVESGSCEEYNKKLYM